jgi:hypothetical protein
MHLYTRKILEASSEKWGTVNQLAVALEYSDHGKLIHRIHSNRVKYDGKTTMLSALRSSGKRLRDSYSWATPQSWNWVAGFRAGS